MGTGATDLDEHGLVAEATVRRKSPTGDGCAVRFR